MRIHSVQKDYSKAVLRVTTKKSHFTSNFLNPTIRVLTLAYYYVSCNKAWLGTKTLVTYILYMYIYNIYALNF